MIRDALKGSIRAGMSLPGAALRSASAVGTTVGASAADLFRSRPDDELSERDPDYIRSTLPGYRSMAGVYFRPDVRGLENIPDEGPVLLVGNHSGGTLIADTFVFAFEFYEHFGPDRLFHQLTHDVAIKLPALSAGIRKYGAVSASHENGGEALDKGAAVLVYPGGDWETYRPSWHQDQIEFGGRSGFIRLALERGVPIVPVVAIGGQETALFVTRGHRAAKALGLEDRARMKVFPIQVAPPFGVTVLDLPGRLPLPAQITIDVLPPINLEERFGPEPDEDEAYEGITSDMQQKLDELSEERDLPLVGSIG